MIRIILLFFISVGHANNCFDRSNCQIFNSKTGRAAMQITHYHCIMKCANILSKETMNFAVDNMQDKLNHQCIYIENLDYCVQKWKHNFNMDCEGPIKNMVQQNFQVSQVSNIFKK